MTGCHHPSLLAPMITSSTSRPRRGMLLLLVLLALSLFLAVGVMLMTIGVRARLSARAHGDARFSGNAYDGILTAALDEALLTAIRGSASGTNPADKGSVRPYVSASSGAITYFESLLHDKYGSPVTGTAIGVSGFDTPVLTLTLARSSLSSTEAANSPATLNGRIMTIRPNAPGTRHRSFRILGSATSGPSTIQCLLANPPSGISSAVPSGECGVVINGREFTATTGPNSPEPWDAYDDANLWLAHPVLKKGQVIDFSRMSYSGTAAAWPPSASLADNDNDGLEDGVWFRCGSPLRSPHGGDLTFEVSYLIVDLDGRININAAGMARTGSSGYSTTPANVPLGAGYGPADIDPSLLFPATVLSSATNTSGTAASPFALSGTLAFNPAYTLSNLSLSGSVPWEAWLPVTATVVTSTSGTGTTPAKWPTLLIAGPTASPYTRPYQRRATVATGVVTGRYGLNGVPGLAGDDANQQTNAANYVLSIAGTDAAADLQGRSRIFSEPPVASATPPEIMPRLTHFLPTSSADWSDDPYETRLDGISTADDTPFTLAEFERILRADDGDANELPLRLAAALADVGQVSRMTFTTDSWDSPALSGSAARVVEQALSGTVAMLVTTSGSVRDFPRLAYSGSSSWLSTSGTANPISPDVAAGLRFNLNRPVTTPAERHEYCKGLYTLALILNGTTSNTAEFRRAAAQWAVNALDFRDEDSDCTGFEYDDDLSDGWTVDGNLLTGTSTEPSRRVVWGAERPDVIITQAGAWQSSSSDPWRAIVTLHHPFHLSHVKTVVSGSLTTTGTIGRVAASLTSGTGIDLRKRPAANADPIWRLQLSSGSSTQLAQFVSSTVAGILTSSSSALPLQLDSNQYVCVHASGSSPFTISTGPGFFAWPMDTGGTFGSVYAIDVPGTVTLLRLATGTSPFHPDTNPYVEMDSAQLEPLTGTNSVIRSSGTTATAFRFWLNRRRDGWVAGTGSTTFGPYSISGADPVPRIHWPNRPFISQAELALVPTGTSGTSAMSTNHALMNYGTTIFTLVTATTGSATTAAAGLMLDATYVPTRFVGCASSGTGSDVERLGFSSLGAANLSSWREPGRVNVNTVVTGTDAQSPGPDNIVWTTLGTGSNPFVGVPRIRPQSAFTGTAAASITHMLSLNAGGAAGIFRDQSALTTGTAAARSGNPYFEYARAIGLANTATIRSNVFAVWVSVRVTDNSPNAPPPVVKRVFAIVDRSIPVGYSPGEDLNVQECIRMKRYLD